MLSIPTLGYGAGTAKYAGYNHNIDGTEILIDIVNQTKEALELGFRHLDLAEMYGNDREIELALQQYSQSSSNTSTTSGTPPVLRKDLWITSKVYQNMHEPIVACQKILDRVGCQYLDLYLLHAPIAFRKTNPDIIHQDINYANVWKEMEKLVEMGLVKQIGVSNFRRSDLEELLPLCKIKPVMNQVEFNPYLQQPFLQKYCEEHGIKMAAYAPLASLNLFPGGPIDVVVATIANTHNLTPAQVLLQYTQQKGYVALTTTSKRERVIEYLSSQSSSLSVEEIQSIDTAGSTEHKRKYWSACFAPTDTDAGIL